MAVCETCGFDGHTSGQPCGVCGSAPPDVTNAADSIHGTDATEVFDWSNAVTIRGGKMDGGPGVSVPVTFRGRYEIGSMLGKGGMGAVYRVTDRTTGKPAALKILHFHTKVDDAPFRRFQREVRILRKIEHPLIPRIHDAGLHESRMFLVTDFVSGRTLRDVVRDAGRLPAEEVARIGAFIAQGIEAAHHHGVIHRDIKPHNVMITDEGEVRLLDFGIARDVARGAKSITDSGMLIGTPEYMSPEQFQGEKVDARTDVYSLGVVLYQLATGRLPFAADTPISLGMKHVSEPPPQPRLICAEVPVWLNRIILKCLEKRREDRYPTAGDLANDLESSSRSRRRVHRVRSGDFLIEDETGESGALIIAAKKEKDWPDGSTILIDGTYYRLDRREYDESMPAPWIYRLEYWSEAEVIRKLIEYDPNAAPEAPGARSILGRWLGKGEE